MTVPHVAQLAREVSLQQARGLRPEPLRRPDVALGLRDGVLVARERVEVDVPLSRQTKSEWGRVGRCKAFRKTVL